MSPQADAGMRIDPAPSLACASVTMPLAVAAAAPPLEPPAEYSVSQGLRVAPPYARASVLALMPISGEVLRPMGTKPAAM